MLKGLQWLVEDGSTLHKLFITVNWILPAGTALTELDLLLSNILSVLPEDFLINQPLWN